MTVTKQKTKGKKDGAIVDGLVQRDQASLHLQAARKLEKVRKQTD